jgi:hypothetical protein
MATTTLKLDWSAARIAAVVAALKGRSVAEARRDLEPYLSVGEPGATLKLSWPPALIAAVVTTLDAYMGQLETDALRARDNEPGLSYADIVATQATIHAAAREIREYRAAVAAVIAENR